MPDPITDASILPDAEPHWGGKDYGIQWEAWHVHEPYYEPHVRIYAWHGGEPIKRRQRKLHGYGTRGIDYHTAPGRDHIPTVLFRLYIRHVRETEDPLGGVQETIRERLDERMQSKHKARRDRLRKRRLRHAEHGVLAKRRGRFRDVHT